MEIVTMRRRFAAHDEGGGASPTEVRAFAAGPGRTTNAVVGGGGSHGVGIRWRRDRDARNRHQEETYLAGSYGPSPMVFRRFSTSRRARARTASRYSSESLPTACQSPPFISMQRFMYVSLLASVSRL